MAKKEYELFWRELREDGWEPVGLVRVAMSLLAVRLRLQGGATALRYSGELAQFVSPSSLGWQDGEASVVRDRTAGASQARM